MTLQKHPIWRSKKLRDAARGESCTICDCNDGTTVLAHFNNAWGGKGLGLKADDLAGVHLCQVCHARYDGRSPGPLEDWELLRAFYRTMRRLIERGILKL